MSGRGGMVPAVHSSAGFASPRFSKAEGYPRLHRARRCRSYCTAPTAVWSRPVEGRIWLRTRFQVVMGCGLT